MTQQQKESLENLHDLLIHKYEMIADTLEDDDEMESISEGEKYKLELIAGQLKDVADEIFYLIN